MASWCLAIAPADQWATMTRPERCWLTNRRQEGLPYSVTYTNIPESTSQGAQGGGGRLFRLPRGRHGDGRGPHGIEIPAKGDGGRHETRLRGLGRCRNELFGFCRCTGIGPIPHLYHP